MKKLLLLGGSAQQIVAIKKAKEMGCYTVLCDYLQDNPGQFYADKFYLISTTDKEKILEIAKSEAVDGIIAYASDPAAPTAAFVAEKLNLPTNPYNSVFTLCYKDKFREFLRNNGFNAPKSNAYDSLKTAKEDLFNYNFPVIIKPVDSSGSKGINILYTIEDADFVLNSAFGFSRSKRIIIEEYLQKNHPYLIGGDIFVHNGKIILWGLMNCHRDSSVNNLVPAGKSFPVDLDEDTLKLVKETLQKLIDKLNIANGAMNVELLVDKHNKVYLIDVGPRNGGNMIPNLMQHIFKVDIVEMSIKAALGEEITADIFDGEKFYATHNLHSRVNGQFEDVIFSKEISNNILCKYIYIKTGDTIEYFDNASKAIGVVIFKFNNKEEMFQKLTNINKYIQIKFSKKDNYSI